MQEYEFSIMFTGNSRGKVKGVDEFDAIKTLRVETFKQLTEKLKGENGVKFKFTLTGDNQWVDGKIVH